MWEIFPQFAVSVKLTKAIWFILSTFLKYLQFRKDLLTYFSDFWDTLTCFKYNMAAWRPRCERCRDFFNRYFGRNKLALSVFLQLVTRKMVPSSETTLPASRNNTTRPFRRVPRNCGYFLTVADFDKGTFNYVMLHNKQLLCELVVLPWPRGSKGSAWRFRNTSSERRLAPSVGPESLHGTDGVSGCLESQNNN